MVMVDDKCYKADAAMFLLLNDLCWTIAYIKDCSQIVPVHLKLWIHHPLGIDVHADKAYNKYQTLYIFRHIAKARTSVG